MAATVLIADDSATVRAVLSASLKAAGHDVVAAADGDEALTLLRDSPPDVVLLDIDMPGRDGLAVLAAMRTETALERTPVIFLSGRVSAEDVKRGLELGAHDYLRKPVEDPELLARVQAALRTKALEDQLRRLASVDHLTGIKNRRVASEAVASLCSLATRHGRDVCVALFDVDHFKHVNDEHGHEAGDRVLVELAALVSSRVRRDDVFARWGGEEFLLVLPETGLDGATALLEEIRATLANATLTVSVTVSIGLAVLDGDSPDGLLQRADDALYAAKAAGRDRIVVAGDARRPT